MGARVRPSQVIVPVVFAAVIALAALSYFATRATIVVGPQFAVLGATDARNAFTVTWRTGTEIAVVASFEPSRAVRIRAVTLDGLDPKDAFVASSEYGFWDGRTSLPLFTSEADPLPPALDPHPFRGAFLAPAHSRVFVRLLVQAISDAKATEVISGLRVDAESWSWAHTTLIPFQQPIKLEKPR